MKSLLPRFVMSARFEISLPRFVIFLDQREISKAALICNPLIAPVWNPEIFFPFFCFPHFDTGIWGWITFDFVIRIWWNLVWDVFGMIPTNNLGFNIFDSSHWWYHHLALFWCWIPAWITLDLVVQFWWNFVSETFGTPAKKWQNDLINFKHAFLWRYHLVIWSHFLFTWYKASLNIERDFSFVIVPCHSCY